MIGSIEWDSEEERSRRRHRHKASTIHGWIVKMRGTLVGSETTRRQGIHEMREAHALKIYRKEHPERSRGERGGFFWISPRRSGRSGSREHHREHDDRHHNRHHHDRRHRRDHHHDSRHRQDAYYGERSYGRYLHFPHHRVKPHHYGRGTYYWGVLTRNYHTKDKGRHMMEQAAKERRRERRRRKRHHRDEVLAFRLDSAVNKNRWWDR